MSIVEIPITPLKNRIALLIVNGKFSQNELKEINNLSKDDWYNIVDRINEIIESRSIKDNSDHVI